MRWGWKVWTPNEDFGGDRRTSACKGVPGIDMLGKTSAKYAYILYLLAKNIGIEVPFAAMIIPAPVPCRVVTDARRISSW